MIELPEEPHGPRISDEDADPELVAIRKLFAAVKELQAALGLKAPFETGYFDALGTAAPGWQSHAAGQALGLRDAAFLAASQGDAPSLEAIQFEEHH